MTTEPQHTGPADDTAARAASAVLSVDGVRDLVPSTQARLRTLARRISGAEPPLPGDLVEIRDTEGGPRVQIEVLLESGAPAIAAARAAQLAAGRAVHRAAAASTPPVPIDLCIGYQP